MTFEEAVNKYLDEHGDFGTAMHFGQAMYEAGKAASRRPSAFITRSGDTWNIQQGYKGVSPDNICMVFLRGGFRSQADAKEWARSNGYEVC